MLLATRSFLGGAAQALETFYQSIAHAPTLTPWPSDILLSLGDTRRHDATAAAGERIQGHRLAAKHWILPRLGGGAHAYFIFSMSFRWETEGPQMVVKIIRLR